MNNFRARAIRRGTYFPPRMGDTSVWTEIEVEYAGKKISVWHERCEGLYGDYNGLYLENRDLSEIEEEDWFLPGEAFGFEEEVTLEFLQSLQNFDTIFGESK